MSLVEPFERLAESLPFALLLLTPEGEVASANAEARRRLGCDRSGWSLADRVVESEAVRRYLALCSGGGSRLPGALHLRDGDAPMRCDCSAVSRDDAGSAAYLLLTLRPRPETSERFTLLNEQIDRLHQEVRRREAAEDELASALAHEREARAEAEEANRLKDEFLATVSHELRTPLHAIRGWLHVLDERRSDEATVTRAIEVIRRNAELQTQLVEDVLDVSQVVTGRLRLSVGPVDLAAVVRDAVESVRPAAEAKDIRLQVMTEGGETTVHGDFHRLVQIAWNLLSNAIKFTPKRGRVQVVLKRVNSHVELTVSDTGEGIPPDFLPYVFDRFRQADGSTTRHHGGLGLGLAIVRHLVELHGGLVFGESQGPGRGSTFTVSLPVPLVGTSSHPAVPIVEADGEALAERSASPAALRTPLADLRFLLVEDHPDSLDLLCRILEDAGGRVRGVPSSDEALAAFEEEHPDVVVSDIEMPGEDGYTLIRKLRDLERQSGLPRAPAVAVTAHATREHRLRALRAGYQAFVAKPVDPAELLAVLASVTGRN